MSRGRRTAAWVAALLFALVACLSLSGTFEASGTEAHVGRGSPRGHAGDSLELAGQASAVRGAATDRQQRGWRVVLGLGLSGAAVAAVLVAERTRSGADSDELTLWRVGDQRDRAPPVLT